MNTVEPIKQLTGLSSPEIESVLNDLDRFHVIMDEWSNLETFLRSSYDNHIDLSSTFALLAEHYGNISEKAHRVLRQKEPT